MMSDTPNAPVLSQITTLPCRNRPPETRHTMNVRETFVFGSAENFGERRTTAASPTPDDSTASWLDADDSYQVADFLDEASRILHDEDDCCPSDACHDRLRVEYEQWKRIPHLRIIGRRLIEPNSPGSPSAVAGGRKTRGGDSHSDTLRDRVLDMVTETLLRRVLDMANADCWDGPRRHAKTTTTQTTTQTGSLRRAPSGRRIESTLIVSSILPARRNGDAGQSIRRRNPESKSSVHVLPLIETHQKRAVDETTKRWFSAISTSGRNRALPRPVTSVNTAIDVCFDISIDGKSIRGSTKKGRPRGDDD